MWRKATILADAAVALVCEESSFTGKQLIDDEYLRYKGLSDEDFVIYRYNPEVEPPRALATAVETPHTTSMIPRRGDVRKLEEDKERSRL